MLSAFDKEVVAHIPLRAEESVQKQARHLRSKSHKVTYTCNRLLDAGILYPLLAVDVSRLGWNRFTAFLSMGFSSAVERREFVKVIPHRAVHKFMPYPGV